MFDLLTTTETAADTVVPLGPTLSGEMLVGFAAVVVLAVAGPLWLVMRVIKLKRQVRQLTSECDDATTEVRETVVKRRQLRHHLDAVSALVDAKQPLLSLRRYFRTLLPHPGDGFVVLLEQRDGKFHVVSSRGEVPDPTAIASMSRPNHRWTAGPRFPRDFLVPIGERFALLASQLAPGDVDESYARQVIEATSDIVADRAAEALDDISEETEFRTTREMLALRTIAEQISASSDVSLRDYLETLLQHQPFDRASLYLIGDDGADGRHIRRLGHAGNLLHAGVEQATMEHETRLAMLTHSPVQFFSDEELRAAGVDSLVGSAACVLLEKNGRACGVLCLTAATPVAPDSAAWTLLEWSADHLIGLLETLHGRLSMERQATRDALTGLLNRAELDRRLKEFTTAATPTRPCSLILFDLDHFKSVNDTYGHAAGDAALQLVSRLMQEAVDRTKSDADIIAARYGGEELVILLPKTGIDVAVRVAEQVRQQVAQTLLRHDGREIALTTSAGVSSAPLSGATGQELLEAADAALYASKKLGRNRVTEATDVRCPERLAELARV